MPFVDSAPLALRKVLDIPSMADPKPFQRKTRPLAELVDACIAPVLAAQGFAASDIVVGWPEIVGERLAPFCEPVKVQWPRRPGGPDMPSEPATLVVRVESAFALEVQHLAPIIIERVNARYGWRCIGRLAFRQGPVGRDRVAKSSHKPPSPEAVAEAAARLGSFENEGLKEALARLGAGIAEAGRKL
jgi:hypothetical protein